MSESQRRARTPWLAAVAVRVDELQEAEAEAEAARQARNSAIRQAREAGVTYAELEHVTGLSRAQLDAIRKGQSRRQ